MRRAWFYAGLAAANLVLFAAGVAVGNVVAALLGAVGFGLTLLTAYSRSGR